MENKSEIANIWNAYKGSTILEGFGPNTDMITTYKEIRANLEKYGSDVKGDIDEDRNKITLHSSLGVKELREKAIDPNSVGVDKMVWPPRQARWKWISNNKIVIKS